MSSYRIKGHDFPPLQKRIILSLAAHGCQTINEVRKGFSGHYKSCWIAFDSLEKKKVIRKIDVKTYRGREFPRYWLTSPGVFIALAEGATARDLLDRTVKTYPKDKDLQCCLEIAPLTGIEIPKIALSAILSKGKLEESDFMKILLTPMQKDLSVEQFKRLIEILKKYPDEYKRVKSQIEQLSEFLAKMEKMI